MPEPVSYPNYYSTQFVLGNTTTCGDRLDFGFPARYLRLGNKEAVDFYVSLTSGKATTSDMIIRACTYEIFPSLPPLSGLGAKTSDTGASNKVLGVTAWE